MWTLFFIVGQCLYSLREECCCMLSAGFDDGIGCGEKQPAESYVAVWSRGKAAEIRLHPGESSVLGFVYGPTGRVCRLSPHFYSEI